MNGWYILLAAFWLVSVVLGLMATKEDLVVRLIAGVVLMLSWILVIFSLIILAVGGTNVA